VEELVPVLGEHLAHPRQQRDLGLLGRQPRQRVDLEEQALLEGARPDAGRVERADDGQRIGDQARLEAGRARDLVVARAKYPSSSRLPITNSQASTSSGGQSTMCSCQIGGRRGRGS